MEKWIFFLQKYDEILIKGAVILIGLIAMLLLIGILRQIKRLNRSFGTITESIQAYFNVILREEEEEEEEELANARVHSARKAEREAVLEKEHKKKEDEEIVNAVLQEYFS